MIEQFDNFFIQLGAVGVIVLGLLWFSRYLFQYVMRTLKENAEENKKLESEFRDYLIAQAKEHHAIIERNTNVLDRLLRLIDDRLLKHFDERDKANKELLTEIRKMGDDFNKKK